MFSGSSTGPDIMGVKITERPCSPPCCEARVDQAHKHAVSSGGVAADSGADRDEASGKIGFGHYGLGYH